MMIYLLFIISNDDLTPRFYNSYFDESEAYSVGESLKQSDKCNYFYVQKSPLIRAPGW